MDIQNQAMKTAGMGRIVGTVTVRDLPNPKSLKPWRRRTVHARSLMLMTVDGIERLVSVHAVVMHTGG